MSLETAAYVSQLNATNPPAGDPIANAADHLRLIKSVLLNQFPNLGTTQVTSTALQLTQGVTPTGGIIMWYGSVATIPAGWGLCDGSTYTKADASGSITAPDLRDRFVVGGGTTYTIGTTGGATSHYHNVTVAGHSLSVAELPSVAITVSDPGHTHTGSALPHGHSISDPGHTHGGVPLLGFPLGGGGGSAVTGGYGSTSSATTGISVVSAGNIALSVNVNYTGITAYIPGSWATHTHTGSYSDYQNNSPPYRALAFIMKL